MIPSPEQWKGGSMHQIYKEDNKKCIDTKSDMHITLLQIRSTPLGPGFPSTATLLFNFPIRGVKLILSRLPIRANNDQHYEALVERKTKRDKIHDSPRF